MGLPPLLAGHSRGKGYIVKVRNIGTGNYVGPGNLIVGPGEVVLVDDRAGAYLLSDDCPGKFEAVVEEKPKPTKPEKDKK